MNLRERGITVGDLLVMSILIIITLFISNKVKESDKQSNLNIVPEEISIKTI